MEKISIDELKSILKELGHSDEEIEEVISKKEETPSDEESKQDEPKLEEVDESSKDDADGEGKGEPSKEEEPEPVETTSPVEDENPVDEPVEPAEPVEEPKEEDLPPVEPQEPTMEDTPLPEGVEEVDPTNPVVDETPTEPVQNEAGVDIQSLLGQLEEYKKANDGLLARIDALEKALKESGVLGEMPRSNQPIGVDDGTRTPDYHDDEGSLDEFLSKVNRGY